MLPSNLHSLPSRQLHLRLGSLLHGVLEGRERVAGGETTGLRSMVVVLPRRAPAGAREGNDVPMASAVLTLGLPFSHPSRALTSHKLGDRVDPVVAPPANVSRASVTNAVHLAACLALAMLSTSCGKKETPQTATEAPKSAAVSDAKIEAAIADALIPTKSEMQTGLEAQAEDILAKNPSKNAQDLLSVPEVNEALKAGLTKLSKDKKLQDQINNSVALAAKMKGLSGEPGTVGLDLDLKGYDKARKSRMLQTVLSEDPKRIVSFLAEEIGEAAPELAFGGVQRASNGVALKEQTPPPKPAAASTPD